MAEFNARRMTLAGKVEAVEGTAETLAAADANALAYDVKFSPNQVLFPRKPVAQDLAAYSAIPGSRSMRATFKAELKGSGAAGTAPAIGKYLRGCGMSETVNASVSVIYQRALGQPTLSLGLYSLPASGNNLRMLLKGARGTWKMAPKIGDPSMIEFDFLGADITVADIAGITPSGLEATKPQPFLSTGFTMQSFSHKISTFGLDFGNQLALRGDIAQASGYFSCIIVDAEATFSMDPEKELVASHDYYNLLKLGTEGSMSVAIGATAGNICTITSAKTQYSKVEPADRDGIGIFQVEGKLNRNSGNDDLVITFT
jgi:hypothetical protein